LALRLESRYDLRRIHSGFNDFQRNMPSERMGLFGEPDLSHPPLTQWLKQPVRTNRSAGQAECWMSLCLGGVIIRWRVERSAHAGTSELTISHQFADWGARPALIARNLRLTGMSVT
jgi:hypothetical protein